MELTCLLWKDSSLLCACDFWHEWNDWQIPVDATHEARWPPSPADVCQKSLDTIFVPWCPPASVRPIRADTGATQQVAGWTGSPPLHTPLLRSWLQMERSHFTWLILASCWDASAALVLWCQWRASGLDNPPPPPPLPSRRLNSSIIYEPGTYEPVWLLSVSWLLWPPRILSEPCSWDSKKHTGMCITCIRSDSFIHHHHGSVCLWVCVPVWVCVCV